jgi:2-polyprenyl-3-methyl-5-hydroxy-6-metoxy-1,4-benzoquinol methylase
VTSAIALALIQAHHNDLLPGDADPSHYCITRLRESRHIDRIVIAAPDAERNRAFLDLAARWGVECFLGDELDVVRRLIGAAQLAGAGERTPLARVLLNKFFLDTPLVDRMIDALVRERADFVALPTDFDIQFGADVLRLSTLRQVDRMLAAPENGPVRFRPWLFIEEHPDAFKTVLCHEVPTYPRSRLDEIRASNLFAQRDCGGFSLFSYTFARRFLSREDRVLDIACGSGDGSAALAAGCGSVTGCDLCEGDVEEARERHRADNLRFEVQDGCALTFPDGAFDAVTTLHTLEHLPDDRAFLANLFRVTRPGGKLVLEVPLLRKRPFNHPILSVHLREYEREPLLGLIAESGYRIEQRFGVNRGQHVAWERAREAVMVVARRPFRE